MNGSPVEAFRAAVAASLGAAPERIEPGRRYRFSVNGKPSDSAGWCLLNADGRIGWYGDWRSGAMGVWRPDGKYAVLSRAERSRAASVAAAERASALAAERARNRKSLEQQWAECLSVADGIDDDDPVARYLRNRLAVRQFECLSVPAALRLHPALPYFHEGQRAGTWPAMVAELTAADGTVATLHRTWVTGDGRKAPTPGPNKKLAPACADVLGGCIRLVTAAEWSGELLGIAEGIETAMAARIASDFPTVAAYSAGAMAEWRWPPTLRKLVIFADHDAAGLQASERLKARARSAGLWVESLAPTRPGEDWCDALLRQRLGVRQ